jgi:CDP-glucose 4,6-dehydratase
MNSELTSFYKNKKVFITGHTGFKGSWLLYWLRSMGAIIKGYSLAPENDTDLYCRINGNGLCDSIIADIRDQKRLEQELSSFEPDIIFHLAAQPLVRLSYDLPVETFEINAVGTAHLLNAIRNLSTPCVTILITTDKVYENKEWVYPYRETDRLGGLDPYSASKACAEFIIHSFVNSFFPVNKHGEHKKAFGITRAGNVIGGGDWAKDRIIPDIVKALKNNEPVTVRNPYAIRPWQHVLEPLGGYILLAKKITEKPELFSGPWNFGPLAEDNLIVEDLVKKALEVWGSGNYVTPAVNNQPHEAGILQLDINKALSKLQWKPKWNSATAIEKTLSWYKNSEEFNASELIERDIESYTSV